MMGWAVFAIRFKPLCKEESTIDYYVITIPRNRHRLGRLNATVFEGLDGSEFPTTNDVLAAYEPNAINLTSPTKSIRRSATAVTIGYRHLLEHALNTSKADWIVVFEDDAVPLSWFHKGIRVRTSFAPRFAKLTLYPTFNDMQSRGYDLVRHSPRSSWSFYLEIYLLCNRDGVSSSESSNHY